MHNASGRLPLTCAIPYSGRASGFHVRFRFLKLDLQLVLSERRVLLFECSQLSTSRNKFDS